MSGEATINFTPREMELFAYALLCNKSGDFAVDYTKLANMGNFKNANSAKASWCGLRKKLDKFAAQGGGINGEALPTTGKRKKSGDKDDSASPSKKRSKKATKDEQAVKSESESEVDVAGEDVADAEEVAKQEDEQ